MMGFQACGIRDSIGIVDLVADISLPWGTFGGSSWPPEGIPYGLFLTKTTPSGPGPHLGPDPEGHPQLVQGDHPIIKKRFHFWKSSYFILKNRYRLSHVVGTFKIPLKTFCKIHKFLLV